MQLVMVSVRDAKADLFSRPFFINTTSAAIRAFSDEVNRAHEENPYNKHPEDYALYHIGTWDDNTGRGVYFDIPVQLIHAEQCVIHSEKR